MVGLVIMAAGQATRMGEDKLALPWTGSTTILEHTLQTVLRAADTLKQQGSWLYQNLLNPAFGSEAAGLEVVVVARHPIAKYCTEQTIESFSVLGGDWMVRDGCYSLADNIRAGLSGIKSAVSGVGFLPADQIGVDERQLGDLIRRFEQAQPDFLVPWADETSGSPVFFHRHYISELESLQGEQGGKVILQRYPQSWSRHAVTVQFLQDVDTREEYECLKGEHQDD